MNRKKLFWIIGISLALLLICGFSVGFSILISRATQSENNYGVGDAVAIISVEGIIQAGDPPADLFGNRVAGAYSERIIRQLKQANENPDVKAIILRINTPGGGVVPSDEIYEQIVAIEKPILVSMGVLAASGGYYISAPTDEIWANRHTLTGSIGVIIQFVNIEGFIEEYGIEANSITSGDNKDIGSLFRKMTSEEEAIWQSIIDESYDVFVQIIVDGRNLEEANVRELADGRVYTGKQALELGLVDNLGNLPDVIERAAELGGIEGEPRIIDYNKMTPLFGGLLGSLDQPTPVEELQEILHLSTSPTLMYLYNGN